MMPLELLVLIAQVIPDGWAASITQFGVGGVVLAWFMFRTENRLSAIERSCDRMTRAMLITVMNDPHAHPSGKDQAREIMSEIEKKVSGS